MTAWGISPHRTDVIYLAAYNADHYLTLAYQAFVNLDWRIGYFDRDGIIAYTNISWASYAEEVSLKVLDDHILIKSECVGYQALFNDYGQNQRNLDRFFEELSYAEFHLKDKLEQTTQDLIDTIPDRTSINLIAPPMVGKERLRNLLSVFTPQKYYAVTPVLILINIVAFVLSCGIMAGMTFILMTKGAGLSDHDIYRKVMITVGFSARDEVLNGQVWRLLTNTFLHFSLLHLIGNMVVLIYIGSMIESKLGKWNFLLLYVLTGIMASMISVIWHASAVAGGASGAIFGLFGILLALLSTNYYQPGARRALLISTAIFVAYAIIPKSTTIDHAAHLGGLCTGYIFGLIAYWSINSNKTKLARWRVAGLATIITIIFVSAGVIFSPRYQLNDLVRLSKDAKDASHRVGVALYGNDSLGRTHKLDVLNRMTILQLKQLYNMADEMESLRLPSKYKDLVGAKARVLRLEGDMYQLLYKEFKENESYKYRPRLQLITNEITRTQKKIELMTEDMEDMPL